MAGEKRTWVRQAFMKQSFMRRRTTAIYDCWPDPLTGARSGFWKAHPKSLHAHKRRIIAQSQMRNTETTVVED